MALGVRQLLLVEDEPLVASLLAESLTAAGFEVSIADTAIKANKLAAKIDPDVAVLDINLGAGASGLELAYILDKKYPGIALTLLTKHPDLRTAGFSKVDLPAGCGFIRKDLIGDSAAVIEAIEQVIAGKQQFRQDAETSRPLGNLTQAQMDVLRLVAQGFSNAAIASRRETSVRAVELMLNLVYDNLGIELDGEIHPRVEAVRKFVEIAGAPERK
ncbi:MAG: response regulator [Micrococcales bacterium]